MTELIWDGKYDANHKKVAPVRIELPFQNIETVNESAEDRKHSFDIFARGGETEWRNRLIWGDKKYVLPSLMPEFAGKVNLIYIDPPFDTGADFSYTAQIPDDPDDEGDESTSFTKEPSMIEMKAYRDTWGKGLDSYIHWLYDTALFLRELLTEDGSIFVHLGPNVIHYAKAIFDEIFGMANFRNEIIWQRHDPHNDALNKLGSITDRILWYGQSETTYYNSDIEREPLSAAGEKEFSLLELPNGKVVNWKGNEHLIGRRFKVDDATWKGSGRQFTWRGAKPSSKREWIYDHAGMDAALARGELYLRNPEVGAARCRKRYLDENKGILLQDLWLTVGRMKGGSSYPTEKPERLLERIVKIASHPDSLVLDCFCGSGTTAAVAEKLGRRWITCDLGRFAIHTTRKRLLEIKGLKPFIVQNLGKYERQAWAAAELGNSTPQPPPLPEEGELARRVQAELTYRNFILDLYAAEPVAGYTWLHGAKSGRMVHVGAVDSPVAIGDIKSIVQEFWRVAGKSKHLETNGVDVLGWEFAFDINETARQIAAEHKIDLKTKKIPHEVLEKKAVDQGDIRFYELAYLNVKTKVTKRTAMLELKDFIMPPDDIPADVLSKVTHWSQWIDYWAVDWDFKGDTFHNQWQSYRTKKEPKIELSIKHDYEANGSYVVLVKVIDILGNDTTKTLEVKI